MSQETVENKTFYGLFLIYFSPFSNDNNNNAVVNAYQESLQKVYMPLQAAAASLQHNYHMHTLIRNSKVLVEVKTEIRK